MYFLDFGSFSFDMGPILVFLNQPAPLVIFQIFIIGGWLVFAHMLLYFGIHLYQEYRQEKHIHHWKWVLLAVDVPQLNVQTPKAVEQMFNQLAAAYEHGDIGEIYRGGHKQRWFSFEIISIEGYIQFLIWTEEGFRELVETSLYAQYPDAEVTEVEDYVTTAPDHFPDTEYDMWASDITLAENDVMPIRTYREFEHNISKDTVLKDPMGALLESFSRIGPGEQLWLQIIIEPAGNHWKEHAIHKLKEIIGDSSAHGHGGNKWVDMALDLPMKLIVIFGDQIFGRPPSEAHGDEHGGPANKLGDMTPGETKLVEAIENKISHLVFKTKIRALYLARKEVFRPDKSVKALIGAINQFNIPSANSLQPSFGVGASYFGKAKKSAHKKTLLMKAYKKRKMKVGANPFVLNVEELATVWHFPMSHVKTPLLQKTAGKKAEPPAGLPLERVDTSLVHKEPESSPKKRYQTDSGSGGFPDDMKFG